MRKSKMHLADSLVAGVSVSVLVAVILTIWLGLSVRQNEPGTKQHPERRRAHRVSLATSVFVYGWAENEPFSENAKTVDVSATGGLMLLSKKVALSQKLLLTNASSTEDLPCRVVRSAKTPSGRLAVAFEFLHTSPTFWQIEFVSIPPQSSTARKAL
jgi:hypothetical protein